MFCGINDHVLGVFFLRNLEKVSLLLISGEMDGNLSPTFDFSNSNSVAIKDYNAWFNQYGKSMSGNLTDCDLEKEMQKVYVYLDFNLS